MPASTRSIIFRALLGSFAAGLRSQTPLGMAALRHDRAPRSTRWRSWPVFRSPWGRRGLMASAVGEMAADKLPFVPSRLASGGPFFRALFGALAGAVIGSEGRGRGAVVLGAAVGAVGGVAGTYGGYHARRATVEATGLPDPVVALAEDAIAYGMAAQAFRYGD